MPSDTALDGCRTRPVGSGDAALTEYLPERLRRQLDPYDLAAIDHAAREWRHARSRHLPVDIRFSLPLPFRGMFINVLAGEERRSRRRRRAERARRPLATAGNVIFTACLVGVMYTGLIVAALALSGVVE